MNHDELVEAITSGTKAMTQALPEGGADKLATLLEDLAYWSQRFNLTGIREIPAMVSGHVLDSLSVRPYLQGVSVLDVGTGAGFPGLPLAIAEPGRNFELLDGNGKKIGFVQRNITELEINNATARKVRAEDYAPGNRFDTVIARAVAAIPQFIKLTSHLVKEDGVLLAFKGKYPAEELDKIPGNWEYTVIEIKVPGLESRARHLVSLTRRRGSNA